MMYMTDGITMDARMQGGLMAGLKRKLLAAGKSFGVTSCFRSIRMGVISRLRYSVSTLPAKMWTLPA